MENQSFVHKSDFGLMVDHYKMKNIPATFEKVVGEAVNVQYFQFNDELRREFIGAVK